MDGSVTKTCPQCGAEIVVITSGQYLSSSDDDLDFVLHARAREARLAIRSEEGTYTCPACGEHDRLPGRMATSQ